MNETIQKQINLYQQILQSTPDLSREEHIALLYECNKDMRTAHITHTNNENGYMTPKQKELIEKLNGSIRGIETKEQASTLIAKLIEEQKKK